MVLRTREERFFGVSGVSSGRDRNIAGECTWPGVRKARNRSERNCAISGQSVSVGHGKLISIQRARKKWNEGQG